MTVHQSEPNNCCKRGILCLVYCYLPHIHILAHKTCMNILLLFGFFYFLCRIPPKTDIDMARAEKGEQKEREKERQYGG